MSLGPFSLRQGPDTDYARACYERYFGRAPPANVGGIFCRQEWGFGGDSINSIRFSFSDRWPLDRLFDDLQLDRVHGNDRGDVRYLAGPDWWPGKDRFASLEEVYQRAGVEFLWVDEDAGEAFFQRADF
ncbi:MAG: hypothetical protein ABFS02_06825 [Pseudomonadota bacterium]